MFSKLVLIFELFARMHQCYHHQLDKHQCYQHQLYQNQCNFLLHGAIGGTGISNLYWCYSNRFSLPGYIVISYIAKSYVTHK